MATPKMAAAKPPKVREVRPKAPPSDAMIPSNAGRQAQSSDSSNQYQ